MSIASHPEHPENKHDSLWRQLQLIRERGEELEARLAPELAQVDPRFAASARNLVHYVALRQFDIRQLQDELATLGNRRSSARPDR